MRPVTLVLNGMLAAPDVVPLVELSNVLAQVVVVVKVVNCAVAYVLLPTEQLVLTLQSYNVADVNPLIFIEVEVVPVAALIHVAEALGL
jgi:hypothetical protein